MQQEQLDEQMLKTGNVPVLDEVHKMPTPANTERTFHSQLCGFTPILTYRSCVEQEAGNRRGRRGSRTPQAAGGDGHVRARLLEACRFLIAFVGWNGGFGVALVGVLPSLLALVDIEQGGKRWICGILSSSHPDRCVDCVVGVLSASASETMVDAFRLAAYFPLFGFSIHDEPVWGARAAMTPMELRRRALGTVQVWRRALSVGRESKFLIKRSKASSAPRSPGE